MRVLKLSLTNEQYKTVCASCHFMPEDDTNAEDWLAEQLTAACQRRIDEVRAAAKATTNPKS